MERIQVHAEPAVAPAIPKQSDSLVSITQKIAPFCSFQANGDNIGSDRWRSCSQAKCSELPPRGRSSSDWRTAVIQVNIREAEWGHWVLHGGFSAGKRGVYTYDYST